MKRTVFQKLGDFVLGKGFYIVLFLCVATIGISGYYLVRTVSSTPGEAEPVTGSPTVVLPDSSQNAAPPHTTPSVTTPTTPTVTEPEDSGSQEASLPQTVEEEPAETVQPVEEDPVPAVFTWPVKGEILSGFSLEVLAYDETMGDWRTHSGVDIAASVGTNVLAISAGTVQGVYDDDLMGTCVVVDHGDGLTSTYCNLSAKPTVSEGGYRRGDRRGGRDRHRREQPPLPSPSGDGPGRQGGGPCELPAPALKDQKSSTPLMGVEPFAVCGIIFSPAPPCLSPREKGPLQARRARTSSIWSANRSNRSRTPGSPMASPGSLAVSSRAKRPGR